MAQVIHDLKLKTAYEDESGCYVTRSAIFEDVIGAGETPEESEKVFYELLEDWLEDEKKQPAPKRKKGRPRKNNSKLTININYKTRAFLGLVAQSEDQTISKIIEDLAEFYAKSHPEKDFGIYQN